MDADKLVAALAANAERARKPIAVELKGVGTIYVRRRTVAEFESDSADAAKEGDSVLSRTIAALICDENGKRYDEDVVSQLVELFAKQPDDIWREVMRAANGDGPELPN